MLAIKFIIAITVLATASTASTALAKCKDNQSFKFGTYFYDSIEYTRDCEWMSETPIKTAERKAKWCNRDWKGVKVGNRCAKTCDKCVTPPPNDDSCSDDLAYSFGKYDFQGNTYTRTCEWITETPIKAAARKAKWCNRDWEGVKVGNRCAKTCSKCSPPPDDDICRDNFAYRFGTYVYQGKSYTRSCKWLTKPPNKAAARKAKWCDADWKGVIVGSKCAKTCDKCITPPPDDGVCFNDLSFQFGKYVYQGYTYVRTCAWLTETPILAAKRKAKWCDRDWEGVVVGNRCAKACGQCIISSA